MNPLKSVAVIMLTVTSMALAQGVGKKGIGDPPELVARRQEHLQAMQNACVPLLNNYLRTLETLRQHFTRLHRFDGAQAVEDEIKKTKQQLETFASVPQSVAPVSGQLTIIRVTFGDEPSGRFTDTTKFVRDAYLAGAPTLVLNLTKAAGGKDPAPNRRKTFSISYSINGQTKKKIFPEGYRLNFRDDLQ